MQHKGFVFIELILVMGVMAILAAVVIVNVFGSQNAADLTQTVDTLIADLRSQQSKAMTGATVNGAVQDGYGIYFETGRYVMFSGSSYNPVLPSNASVAVVPPVRVTGTTLPGNTIVFQARNGEIAGFVPGLNTVTVTNDVNGRVNILRFNRYGVITSLQ